LVILKEARPFTVQEVAGGLVSSVLLQLRLHVVHVGADAHVFAVLDLLEQVVRVHFDILIWFGLIHEVALSGIDALHPGVSFLLYYSIAALVDANGIASSHLAVLDLFSA